VKLIKTSTLSEKYSGTFNFNSDLLISIHEFAESLANIIDAKDPYTLGHSEDVAEISYLIAITYGLSKTQAEKIHIAGHLHDIGKIVIPNYILKKRGPLTKKEWNIVKEHPKIGAKILEPISKLKEIKEMVLYHHERFDGKGYPAGLKGNDIPLGARIIAVADSISAMLKDRAYRKALSPEEALHQLETNSGSQFDPAMVEVTIFIYDKILQIFTNKEEDGNDTTCIDK